ncbi:MAG: hypothetical protein ACRBBW_20475 [Cellvibrionaceae bacterium]
MHEKSILPVAIASPVMTREAFAESSGLRIGQVKGQIERNNIPMYKVGRLNLVNIALLAFKGQVETVNCPVVSPSLFSGISGLTEGQIDTQIDLGNIPSLRVGRLKVVDVKKLYQNCLNESAASGMQHD